MENIHLRLTYFLASMLSSFLVSFICHYYNQYQFSTRNVFEKVEKKFSKQVFIVRINFQSIVFSSGQKSKNYRIFRVYKVPKT
ncbi:hypothetical protein DERP_008136 [Dermatophagoides pteronyssinus]|uniref:Secreted protein n=1 Tax=Dermatophagoides pteronyssinus TaxID=6956 RepID=A0ABQ8JJV3_DERPT|nr:hypothetical protein DERP_008136 [Dermatophagoides pteronyssinus]